jgi:hypothetical protein
VPGTDRQFKFFGPMTLWASSTSSQYPLTGAAPTRLSLGIIKAIHDPVGNASSVSMALLLAKIRISRRRTTRMAARYDLFVLAHARSITT